jgi:hypothetical protein
MHINDLISIENDDCYVPIFEILSWNKMRELNVDYKDVIELENFSENYELNEKKTKIR